MNQRLLFLRDALPKQLFRVVHIHRQHQTHADIQHEHRAAARRVEGQGDTDDGQDPKVHPHIDEDLGHERAADARADEGTQHILACLLYTSLHDQLNGDQQCQPGEGAKIVVFHNSVFLLAAVPP